MTIFGDAIVPHGGEIWLGSLIELLAPFGVNDRLLRTSVFRLAQEGWLSARRDGRRSAYAITPQAMGRFARAYRRIYAPLVSHWDGSWTIVIGTGASIDATQRGALRKELLWEGYSMIAPGIFGHPASAADVLEEMPESEQVDILNQLDDDRAADVLDQMQPDDAADLIAHLSDERGETLLDLMEVLLISEEKREARRQQREQVP